MKRLLAMTWLAACSVPAPSEQYACTISDECAADRVCVRGYCVVGTREDAGTSSPDAPRFDCAGWTPRHFDACTIPQPTGPLALAMPGTYTYDTTTGTLTDPSGGMTTPAAQMVATARVLSVDDLSLASGSTLRVTGMYPLVVAAWMTIQIDGTLDVSSNVNGVGAGANPNSCAARVPPATAGGNALGGAGGAGGGGYKGIGGQGGNGDGALGGPGGALLVTPPLLEGGCAGAKGGDGQQPGGAGGAGGGAVQLTARMGVTIGGTGRVHAGGAGGKNALVVGTQGNGGGGGGGSGGMIGLQGETIVISAGAILAANGGGGGEGSGAQQGNPGRDANLSAVRALGGSGGSDAGDGGLGGALAVSNGAAGGASGTLGGGGGGGGVGYVVLTSPATPTIGIGAVVSPAPTTVAP